MQPVDHLYRVRHSFAHVLAQAVLKLWPDTKLGIGPPIESGCYYDFLFSEPISLDDKGKIEKEMRIILKGRQEFVEQKISVTDAIVFWEKKGQPFKVELIKDLQKEGVSEVSHYINSNAKGEDTFVDLCKGNHVTNTDLLPIDGFAITGMAGVYWRGDEHNPQLTRIYVAAFATKEDLARHVHMLEEAKKRDHRKIGQELDLFVFSDRVGSGLPLFLPKGEYIKSALEHFVREEKEKLGYSFVCIPHIAKKELYEKSGHMGKYDAMMPVMKDREGDEFVLKPMNCPHHFELYNARPHSYKDLPIRFAENTTCYRNEKTGELTGLIRVKALTQDDTHHFVRHDQIEEEIRMILNLMKNVYETFGLTEYKVEISVRDSEKKDQYYGDEKIWETAENTLVKAAQEWGVEYVIQPGEAAFYGPKIDIRVRDAIGRSWQLTTVQLDFIQPENFNMQFVGSDGALHRPAVLHVAILGSSHRFMGVIIEHFAGQFPLWLAPVQIAVLPVASAHEEYAEHVLKALRSAGLRTTYFASNDSLGKRVRLGEKQKIPYLLVLGGEEMSTETVAVRSVKTKKQHGNIGLSDFVKHALADAERRSLVGFFES